MKTDAILEYILNGERISDIEAIYLFKNLHLTELGSVADLICKRLHPEKFRTYVVDRNINYTNICVSKCRFCAFYRDIDSSEAYLLENNVILNKIQEAVNLGATQILMQGGFHPKLNIDYYVSLLEIIKFKFPYINIHSFSPPEILYISLISKLSVKDTLAQLKTAGLNSLPGGGAEILADEIRSRISPNKYTSNDWLNVMKIAHEMNLPTTATMMFGHIDSIEDRIEHLSKIRRLQDETNGFTAFIPWTFQPENTELGGLPIGSHEYLKTLAISRIYLDNIANIQASWVTQGPKIGQIALFFGANDMGSTMIEENVVSAAGTVFHMNESELRKVISEAGYTPCKRNTYYDILENY